MDADFPDERRSLLGNDVTTPNYKRFTFLGCLALIRFFENICSSLPASFFARVMENKGGTVFEAVLASQMRMATFVIFSPIFGRYHAKIGINRLLWIGIFGSVIAQTLFGLFDLADDRATFFVGTMLARLLYGLVKAGLLVAINVIALQTYQDQISMVFGVFQGAAGCGFLLGPGIGGVLYDKYGMIIPVVGSALILLLCGLLPCCLIDIPIQTREPVRADISIRSFISKPLVLATLLVTGSVYGILSYADVAMTLYFKVDGHSSSAAGFALLACGAACAGMAPIIGYLVGKNIYIRRYAVSVGSILYSCIMFAFTPDQYLWAIYVCCVCFGLFCSMSYVPSMEVLTAIANRGRSANPALYGTIAGIWLCALGVGTFVFPIVASLIQIETSSSFTEIFYGLSITNLIIAAVQFVCTVVASPANNDVSNIL